MNEPRHGLHKHKSNASVQPASASNANIGCYVLVAIVVLVLAVSQCGSKSSNDQPAAVVTATEEIAAAIATQTPPPVADLDASSVLKGEHHMPLASKEGLAGDMIYSQNCYDKLSRQFTWAKLDVCGGFDFAVSQELSDDDDNEEAWASEAAWFQSEAAAGRYLKAATTAGEDPNLADKRLDDLQALVAKSRLALPTATVSSASEPNVNDEPAAIREQAANAGEYSEPQ